MTPAQIKLAILAASLLVALAVGFGGGWTINGWRLGAEVARLEGAVETQKQSIETLQGANTRCVASVGEVRAAVKGMVDEERVRSKAAAEAMARAAKDAEQHLKAAKDALSRPPAPPGQECDTAAREAAAYAKKRRAP